MEITAKYAAFFDLDSTILNTSSGIMMVNYLKDKGLLDMRTRTALFVSGTLSRLKLLSPHRAMAVLIRLLLTGRSVSEMLKRDTAICTEYIFPCMRSQAKDEIELHKRSGGAVVLLSASVDTVCGCIGSYLGLDDVLCTVPEKEGDTYTGRIAGLYCYGREKLARAEGWCRTRGVSLADCWYYGDAAADRFLLEAVGNPVCVTPDERLSKLAAQKGWRVLLW